MPTVAPGLTVTLIDAVGLTHDMIFNGNAFVRPTGYDDPTHVRIPPDRVKP